MNCQSSDYHSATRLSLNCHSAKCDSSECDSSEFHSAECHSSDCHSAKRPFLTVILSKDNLLTVILLSIILWTVILLSVSLLNDIVLSVTLHNVIILSVIQQSVILLCVWVPDQDKKRFLNRDFFFIKMHFFTSCKKLRKSWLKFQLIKIIILIKRFFFWA